MVLEQCYGLAGYMTLMMMVHFGIGYITPWKCLCILYFRFQCHRHDNDIEVLSEYGFLYRLFQRRSVVGLQLPVLFLLFSFCVRFVFNIWYYLWFYSDAISTGHDITIMFLQGRVFYKRLLGRYHRALLEASTRDVIVVMEPYSF